MKKNKEIRSAAEYVVQLAIENDCQDLETMCVDCGAAFRLSAEDIHDEVLKIMKSKKDNQ